MKLTEVKKACISLLQSKYKKEYKYYSSMVVEDYQRPCFFTQLKVTTDEPINFNTRYKRANFYITIMQKTPDEVKAMEMIDEIEEMFGLAVKVKDRTAKVTGFEYDFIGVKGNIPEIAVELEWCSKIAHEEETEMIEEVIMTDTLEMEV